MSYDDVEAVKQAYINAGAKESKLTDFLGKHVLNTAPIAIDGGYAVGIDGQTHIFLEDSNDGYRSCMECVMTLDGLTDLLKCAAVVNRDVVGYHAHDPRESIGYKDFGMDTHVVCFVGIENGHVWLSIGTENKDDYYPRFICGWQPMAGDAE